MRWVVVFVVALATVVVLLVWYNGRPDPAELTAPPFNRWADRASGAETVPRSPEPPSTRPSDAVRDRQDETNPRSAFWDLGRPGREGEAPAEPARLEPRPPSRQVADVPLVTPGPAPPTTLWTIDPDWRAVKQRLAAAQEALASDPWNVTALNDAAAALVQLERWDEAAPLLGRLVELRPEDAALRLQYAATLMRLRRWLEALDALKETVRTRPDFTPAWYNLAVAHQRLGHLAEAWQTWDRVIELDPHSPDAHAHRGEILLDLHEWAAAATDFEAALADDPQSPDLLLNLSLALWKLGQLDAARQHALQVLDTYPRHVRALNRLGELAWGEFQLDPGANAARRIEAITRWRDSLAIDPQQPKVEQRLNAALSEASEPPNGR